MGALRSQARPLPVSGCATGALGEALGLPPASTVNLPQLLRGPQALWTCFSFVFPEVAVCPGHRCQKNMNTFHTTFPPVLPIFS